MADWRVITKTEKDAPPGSRIDVVLPAQAAARAHMNMVRGLPLVTRASIHVCSHVAGGPGLYNCRTDLRAQYEAL